jgi:FMN phosphatase YigB (HAD superfamily)
VGDSLGSDVRGASAACIAVAWLDPRARALPADLGVAPVRTVASLRELSAWLRGR